MRSDTIMREFKKPFKISFNTPNSETKAAMKEAEIISSDPNTKKYSSFSELLSEIQEDV